MSITKVNCGPGSISQGRWNRGFCFLWLPKIVVSWRQLMFEHLDRIVRTCQVMIFDQKGYIMNREQWQQKLEEHGDDEEYRLSLCAETSDPSRSRQDSIRVFGEVFGLFKQPRVLKSSVIRCCDWSIYPPK